MDAKEIKLSLSKLGDAEYAILVGIKPWFKYVDRQKTDETIGKVYAIVLPKNNYARLSVKVPGSSIPTEEEIKAVENGSLISFEGFEAQIYCDRQNNECKVSARAARAILIKNGNFDDDEINFD